MKSGAIVPEKIGSKYWMYFLGTSADKTDQMGLAYSPDLLHWTEATDSPVLPAVPGNSIPESWNRGHLRFVTKDGIVLIYNGADDHLVYRTAIAVFDRHDPRKLVWRSEEPIFFRKKLGEGRPGSQRGVCGRNGKAGRAILVLLRGCGQVCRGGRGSDYSLTDRLSHPPSPLNKIKKRQPVRAAGASILLFQS